MTNKALIAALIGHYSYVIDLCKKADNVYEINGIIGHTNTLFGVCYCANHHFNKRMNPKIIKKYLPKGSTWWFKCPHAVNTKPKQLKALKKRLSILKQEYALL